MLLSIQHTTELAYDERISETMMELRVAPRSDGRQALRGFGVAVGPAASLHEHLDWLGNRVHQFSIVEFHDRILILAHSAVETKPGAADLAARADLTGAERGDFRLYDFLNASGPVDADPRVRDIAARLELGAAPRVSDVVERVTRGLRDVLEYKKGVTTSSTPLSRVLDVGAGVCQDFAHLAIALCREVGVPARYVSGYLHRPGAAEVETHAWCEAHFPSVGWLGFDPTHRELVAEHHVAIGVGRSYSDVPPNRGVYRGSAQEKIRATVQIEEVSDVPRGLLAPISHLDVATYSEGAPQHREQIDYQQEQQQQQ